MKIAMVYPLDPPFGPNAHEQIGLGGSENGFIRTAQYLEAAGQSVWVYNRWPIEVDAGNLHWRPLEKFSRTEPFDVVYSLRSPEIFFEQLNAKLRVLFLADLDSTGLGAMIRAGQVDLVMAVSAWQKERIANKEHIHDDYWMVTSNGIIPFEGAKPQDHVPTCIYMATPERGLGNLLDIWPRIHAQVPNSRLLLYSSFMGWCYSREQNEKACQDIYAKIATLADMNVVNLRHGTSGQIREALIGADLYLYPTDFYETCCMSVLEAMSCGAVPVTTQLAALIGHVTNGLTGVGLPPHGASSARYQNAFVDAAVRLLNNADERMRYSENARRYANNYAYERLVPAWIAEWEARLQERR